ncbi:MAG: hypothetical protein AAF958_14030 [Planctomycetota bacterium]
MDEPDEANTCGYRGLSFDMNALAPHPLANAAAPVDDRANKIDAIAKIDGTAKIDGIDQIARAASFSCGRIICEQDRPPVIRRRFFSTSASLAAVWWHAGLGRQDGTHCILDYHVPMGMNAFLTLDYIRSGSRAGYGVFRQSVRVLEQIAIARGSHAIVAHVTNPLISDRLLGRLGWERHCLHWRGRHFIRRIHQGLGQSFG